MLQTDVLILGGGLAALRAAVAARQAGARVLLVVKGKAGQSGCSAITTAGYAAAVASDDTADIHGDDTLRGGAEIADPALVRMLAGGAPAELALLRRLGAAFKQDMDGPALSPSADHSIARVLTTIGDIGSDLTLPVREHALALGVETIESTMVVELVHDGDGICGAVCVDLRRQAVLGIGAAATVLATGGLGRLFGVTSNPRDVTGDGYALAARAGAALRDMEFIQFYPWRCIDPFPNTRVSLQPTTWVIGGRLYNAAGERFMARLNPAGAEATTRDVAARGIFAQIRAGLDVGGGVRADLSELSDAALQRSNPKLARLLARMGIDHRAYPFVVAPEAHYMMGGLCIDTECATTLPRLFAAGEVAGGIHGANRINSNAMPEAMVFGARAGRSAAAVEHRPGDGAAVAATARRWDGCLSQAGEGPDMEAATRALRARAGTWLGIMRDGATMRAGQAELAAMRDAAGTLPPAATALRTWLEYHMLCDAAELCLAGALAREESRGAHCRDDRPERDDRTWRRSIVLRRHASGDLATALQEAA